ncbi:hypothetical protein [Nitrospira sp. Nam80]
MRILLYAVLVLTVAPIQATLLNHVNILDIRPDLGLIVVCLVGFFEGELDGLLLGVMLGWSQGLLSGGGLWVDVVSKSGAGFLAGLAGRHLAYITPAVLLVGLGVISCLSNLAFLYSMKSPDWDVMWHAIHSKVLIQAIFDAALGTAVYWWFMRRSTSDQTAVGDQY